jgi:acyl transferase domain-containing protein/NADPH:quinone reductase-like Zn-dependent oxidoreductase/NAD(P)-dependent dehydrogenase (short-subunit alcohol dehydrogenase family)/acyl carrier protein
MTAMRTLSGAKIALAARQFRENTPDIELSAAEPLAIIGIGCRFAGGVTDSETLWNLLKSGRNVTSNMPFDRLSNHDLRDGNVEISPDGLRGAFLDDIDRFDADYFGIAPREAAHMDPQQRMLLELSIEAIEDAGLLVERLRRSATGVFAAIYNHDFLRYQHAHPDRIAAHTASGTSPAIAAGRISFLLDLNGPSIIIDTACSSSLVAAHLACTSLRNRECDLAIVGGAGLILGPETYLSLSKWGMLAPDGRCKTFDARADGFGRGEGGAVVIIKRLAEALRDGDRVRSIIRGTAINQDGRSTDLTAPNGLAQQDVIRRALRAGQVSARDIGYVEAHGTGTQLGDPIEIEALTEVLGDRSDDAIPCALSSIKANVGHLEATAGVAGLIKSTLVLEHAAIPPQALFETLNPHIDLEDSRFYVPTQQTEWSRGPVPRLAGVSSFGFSGTNAHAILEEPPRRQAAPTTDNTKSLTPHRLLVVTAKSETALQALAGRYADRVSSEPEQIDDICFTAALRRTHHDHRLAVVAGGAQELAELLRQFATGARSKGVVSGLRRRAQDVRPVLVFSGQGPQWSRMGLELFDASPVFREALNQCDTALRRYSDIEILKELAAGDATSRLAATEIAQPCIFAVQTALAAVWRSWGVTPAAVIGHSVGEVAAAHVAGIVSLDEAARIVVHRSRLMQRATGSGRMASIELPVSDVKVLIRDAGLGVGVAIAAVNAPDLCVIAGAADAVNAVVANAHRNGAQATILPVDYAFHSPQMETHAKDLGERLTGLAPRQGDVPFLSTVTGGRENGDNLTASYWRRNVRDPVRFADAVTGAMSAGHRHFLEIGPHPVLSQALHRCGRDGIEPSTFISMRRAQPQLGTMLASLAGLFANGLEPAWKAVQPHGTVVSLPRYAWGDARYPVPRYRDVMLKAPRRPRDPQYPILGARVPLAGGQLVFEKTISISELPYLPDHAVEGRPLLPGAFYSEAVLELADAIWEPTIDGQRNCRIDSMAFDRALILEGTEPVSLQVIVKKLDAERAEFGIFSLVAGTTTWTEHATGSVLRNVAAPSIVIDNQDAVSRRCAAVYDHEAFYAALAATGPQFGPAFRGIESLSVGVDEAWSHLEIANGIETGGYRFHPTLLDAVFQTAAGALGLLAPDDDQRCVYVVIGIDGLHLIRAPVNALRVQALVRRDGKSAADAKVDLKVWDPDDNLIALVDGLTLRATSRDMLADNAAAESDCLWTTVWRETPIRPPERAEGGRWLVVDASDEAGASLAQELQTRGIAVRRHPPGTAISQFDDCAGIVLLAKRGPDLAEIGTEDLQTHAVELCQQANDIAVEATRQPRPSRLIVVTSGAQQVDGTENHARGVAQAALWGWRNSLALEHPELRAKAVDLDPDADAKEMSLLADEIVANDEDERVAYRHNRRFVARLTRANRQLRAISANAEPPAVRLVVDDRGSLDAFSLQPTQRRTPGPGEVEIQVHAAGLNFRDVMNALGTYPGDAGQLGDECAGVIVRTGVGVEHLAVGDEVMAMLPGSFASYVTGNANLVTRRPATLSLEQAAGVPIVFLTAAIALEQIAGLRREQNDRRRKRVLIHAGAGGVGLAAISLALHAGAEVFATAGSQAKRDYLRSLGVPHVMDSRSPSFSELILKLTDGEGVDVVLNSLAGEFIPASLAVVRKGGHFLEIGRTNIWTSEQVAALGREIQYSVIFLGDDQKARPEMIGALMGELAQRIDRGEITVPRTRIYPIEQARSAFRLMALARHSGKLVLRLPVASPVTVHPDASYLVTGGLSGLGLVAAATLADIGARHLLLVGRTAQPDATARAEIARLEATGCTVQLIACDVGSPGAVACLEASLATLPPLRGIVHAAGILDDGPIETLGHERWLPVMLPKAAGSLNLHQMSLRREMDFFVLFSAGAALLGSAGQANYTAANSVTEAIAGWRRASGMPALAIQWGGWTEVGMVARLDARNRERWHTKGMNFITPREGARWLGELLGRNSATATVAVIPARWDVYAAGVPEQSRRWLGELVDTKPGTHTQQQAKARTLRETLETAPISRRREMLLEGLTDLSRAVLGVGAGSRLPEDVPLRDLGLDSLMAVELRNLLAREGRTSLPATLLFDHPTLEALSNYLSKTWDLVDVRVPKNLKEFTTNSSSVIDGLSDMEIEELLRNELSLMRGPQ